MATLYVNKSGSDANNGSSAALAKLTIDGAVTASSSGDTIEVGSGSYNESLSWASKTLTFQADGVVILDGTGLAANKMAFNLTTGSNNVTIQHKSTGGVWIMKNFTNSYLIGNSGNSSTLVTLQNCWCFGGGTVTTVYLGTNASSSAGMDATNCLFAHFSGTLFSLTNNGNHNGIKLTNCTVHDFGTLTSQISGSAAANVIRYANNIFSSGTTAANVTASSRITTLNPNQYNGVTNLLNINGTLYTTLAAVQGQGFETNGASANPNFLSTSQDIYVLTATPTVPNVGCFPYAFARGQAYNPDSLWTSTGTPDNSGWYCAGGGITLNGTTGFFELTSGSSDSIVSPVYDLGASSSVTRIRLFGDEVYPTNLWDTTKTDTQPNYQTLEVRASGSSFAQDAGSPSWTEVKRDLPLTGITGRYLQLRVTFRSDDVAA